MNRILVFLVLLMTIYISCKPSVQQENGSESDVHSLSATLDRLGGIRSADSLVFMSNQLIAIYEEQLSDSALANLYYQLAMKIYRLSNLDQAAVYFNAAETLFREGGMRLKAAQMKANQAVILELKGNYKEAINNYLSTAEVFKTEPDTNSWASALSNIAIVYEEMGIASKAIEYYRQSLELKLAVNNLESAANNYNNLGVLYEELIQNEDSALYFYQKALEIFIQENSKRSNAKTRNNLAMIFMNRGEYHQAQQNLNRAIYIFDSLGDLQNRAVSLKYLGELYFRQRMDMQALKVLEESFSFFQNQGDKKNELEVSALLSKVYMQTGLYQRAFELIELSNNLKDTLMNVENRALIAEMESKYQLKEKNKTIEVLTLEDEIKQKKLNNQTIITSSLLIILLLISVIYFKHRNNHRLEQRQLNLELQNYVLQINQMQNQLETKSDCQQTAEDKIKEFDLSEREAEVLKYIAEGFKNAEIAKKMFLSENTIKSHIKNIYIKLDVKNRVAALKKVEIM